METAKTALLAMKKGHVTTLWDRLVIRCGDTWVVGSGSISIRSTGVTLEEAAAILCAS